MSVEDDSGKSDEEEEEEEEEEEDTLDESEDEDVSDDGEDEGVRAKSGKKKTSGSDRTEKFFKDPGMFSLEDMENFMDQGDEEEEERRRMNERDGVRRLGRRRGRYLWRDERQ